MRRTIFLMLAALAAGIAEIQSAQAAEEVNLYTIRQPRLVQPALDAFAARTGIEVNVLTLETGLVERMKTEAENSPADVILAADIRRLTELASRGLTQPLRNAGIEAAVPAGFRDPGGEWFGLTLTARAIYASRERVPDQAIGYADLANPAWKGRICMRDGMHSSNIGLISAMIVAQGATRTASWLSALKANLNTRPSGNDLDQARAISEGRCDLALGNVPLMPDPASATAEDKAALAAIRVIAPAAEQGGTYVDISGIALARYAPNRAHAVALMEFLLSPEAQQIIAQQTQEQPVVAAALPGPTSRGADGIGVFQPAKVALSEALLQRSKAGELVATTHLNDGP